MKVGRPESEHRARLSPPALVFPPGTPLSEAPPNQGNPRGENPSPHAFQAPFGARRGAPGGLRAGPGPRPGCARALCISSPCGVTQGPASRSTRPPPGAPRSAARLSALRAPAACRPLSCKSGRSPRRRARRRAARTTAAKREAQPVLELVSVVELIASLLPQEPRARARFLPERRRRGAVRRELHRATLRLDARHQLHVDPRARAAENSRRGFRAAPCTSRQGSRGCKPRNALGKFPRSTTKHGRPQSVPLSRAHAAESALREFSGAEGIVNTDLRLRSEQPDSIHRPDGALVDRRAVPHPN